MPSQSKLKKELERAARLKDPAERAIFLAAVIAEALREVQQDPILVGGAAVTFYTEGKYTTADIDMIADGGPDLWKVMSDLGFQKIGKDYVEKKLKIYIEFPGHSLKPHERIDKISVGQKSMRIISLEDLIVDRLCAFKFWQSGIDGVNALLLLEQAGIDEDRLVARADEEDVKDSLQAVREVARETIRKKLSRKKANRLLEEKMRQLRSR